MTDRQTERPVARRARRIALAALVMAAAVAAGGLASPQPALAWWRGGVWIGGPGYYPYRPYDAPRPYYYAPPPVYVAPPPVVVAPPPVVYAAPPPVYYPPPPPAPYPVVARSCFTPNLSCPMEVPRAPGSACYCSDALGNRSWGSAH